jgi:P4 family phage/plasmid primase-like protien
MVNRRESLLGLKDGDGRNATLFAHLMAYKNRGATDEQIEEMAEIINTIIFAEPMTDDELNKIVENTKKYEATKQFDNPYLIYNSKGAPTNINHRAICDYFVNKGDIFVLGGECYEYKDGVYTESSSRVRNTIKDLIAVDNLITQNRIMECFRLICDDVRLQRTAAELNRDKNLINFKNGVWDIEQGELLPHDSKYLQTLQIPHPVGEYKPFKETRLYGFFKKTGLPKADIKMLLNYMAYCLTLDYCLKTFMILCGQSNTGKSVLIRFFENLVGKVNVSSLSMHELNMRFYPSQLYNRLLNSCADNSSLPLSSIENLKKITGGDQIMHEKKGKEPFFFVPFCKLIFSFNQLPLQLEEKSNAFYKRMRILFMNTELFLDNDYVDDLCSDEGVTEVIPYLLKLLPITNIPRTSMSDRYVEALRQDSDSIHAFLTRYCETGQGFSVEKGALYEAYCRFCVDTGRENHKKHSFMRNLRSQGFKEARDGKSREYLWTGIQLKKGVD